jgi:hypothetical protein
MTFDDTPPELLSLKIAQSYVESGNGTTDLAGLVANEDSFLNATERELIDRIFGYAPLDELLQDEIDAFDQLAAKVLPVSREWNKAKSCINAGPDITNAQQLSDAMLSSAIGDAATNPDSPAGQTLSKLGVVLSVGGVIPGFGTAFSVAGAGLAAWQAGGQYLAGVYPSSLVNLTYDIDRTEFPEDFDGYAQWSNVMVTAASTGWTADAALANTAISALGPVLSSSQKFQIVDNGFLDDVIITGVNMELGEYLSGRDGGLIEFCADQWTVDITDLPFSTGGVLDRRFEVDPATRQVRPKEVGADALQVAAQPVKFAGRKVHLDKPLNTKPIIVGLLPDDFTVQTPGEIVNLTATITNADTETLLWDAAKGSWDDGVGDETNGPRTRPLKTPTSESDYPFLVTVYSTSTGGIRASGEPKRFRTATIRYQDVQVIVSPQGGCVANGDPETFSANVLGTDDQTVTWTLENEDGSPSSAGSIGATTGNYVAPNSGSGTVVIVATSSVDATAQGRSFVEYGPCECFWEFIVPGDTYWTGNFASHDFGQFAPYFLMSFLGEDTSSGGGLMQAVNGPGAGQTGSFPTTISFQDNVRFWTSVEGDEGTEATMTLTKNTTDRLEGSVTGTALTVIAGEEVIRAFTLNFRSAHVNLSGELCGGE